MAVFPRWLGGKESTFQSRRLKFNPWIGKIPWRRKWQPSPVFLPGKSCRLRSLAGCSSWGRKELDTTDTHTHTSFSCILTWQKGEREEITYFLESFLTVSFMGIPSSWLNHFPTSQPPNTIPLGILISDCEFRGKTIFSPWQISIQILSPFLKRFHLYKRSFDTCLSLIYFISLLPSRSTHIVTDGKISSFFIAKSYSIAYIHIFHFLYPWTLRLLLCWLL